MKKIILPIALIGLVLSSCSNEESNVAAEETVVHEEVIAEPLIEEEVVSFYGTYNLSDMVPVTDGKELTEQDETYIKDSKERTIGHTTLTFNEDGSFERVFPHPSGDGTTNTWTGTYEMNEEAGTLVLNAEMNGKTMPMNFTIEEKTDNSISMKTDFGQIFMTYVYTK